MDYVNYFAHPAAAERYAFARPFFHPLALERIRSVCGGTGRPKPAVDIGCGTGQSSLALLEIADEVIGLDISADMLAHAKQHPRIHYLQGQAEKMPFADTTFPLMTTALAFHWFEQARFMPEARRVLKPHGWLVIYNDGFAGQMIGNPQYERWNREKYLERYPTPSRRNTSLTSAEITSFGFLLEGADEFSHNVEFEPAQLVAYLLTQTNVISAVEQGSEDVRSASERLLGSVCPFFGGIARNFVFSCRIQFLRRVQ